MKNEKLDKKILKIEKAWSGAGEGRSQHSDPPTYIEKSWFGAGKAPKIFQIFGHYIYLQL